MRWLADAVAVALAVGLVAAVGSGLLRFVGSGGRRPVPFGAAALDGAIFGSLAAVAVATLSPIGRFLSQQGSPDVHLAPFERLDGAPVEYAVINLLLLVPTIVLLAQRWRRAGVVRLTMTGVLLSLVIEGAQLFHPLRGTNVDDVLLNAAGAAGAAVIGVALRWAVNRRRRQPASGGRPPLEAEVPPLQPMP